LSILSILKDILNKEKMEFINEAYNQILNRQPNHKEIQLSIFQLDGIHAKIDLINKLIETEEAKGLFEKPIHRLNNGNLTIADIIRTFFTANVIYFVRSAFKEILGYEFHRPPDLQSVQSLTMGTLTRTRFLTSLVKQTLRFMPSSQFNPVNNSFQGYYSSSWDWAQGKESHHIIPLYEEEEISIRKPKGIDSSIDWNSLVMYKKLPRPFVVSIPSGQFWGGCGGAIFTSEGKILADVSQEIDLFQDSFRYNVFANKKLPPVIRHSENIAVLRGKYDINYFHWMFDVVARLDLLRKAEVPIDKYIVNVAFPYQDELLTSIGIPKEKRIQNNVQLNISAHRLLVPSYTGSSLGVIPKWACEFLRKELMRNVEKIHGYERIYISRKNAHHRKVENDNDVMNVLRTYGFREVFLEREPIERKIQIFNSAKVIIAPHGAGLTNLVFCESGTKVIEMFNPNWILPCYWMISNHVGLDYYYVLGKGGQGTNPLDIKRMRDNIKIDLNHLVKILEMALDGGRNS